MILSDFFLWTGVFCGFVLYPILYRMERNYFNKHRKELSDLLFGYDPWSKTLSWSDHLLMIGAIGSTFLLCRLPKKDVQQKIASGKFESVQAPNVFRNGNYLKLRNSHPRLEKFVMADILIFFVLLVCGGMVSILEKS